MLLHHPVQRTVRGRARAVAGRSDSARGRGTCARREGATRLHAPADCRRRAEGPDPGVSRGCSVRRSVAGAGCSLTSHLAGNDLLRGGGDPQRRERARGYGRAPALELPRRHHARQTRSLRARFRCSASRGSARHRGERVPRAARRGRRYRSAAGSTSDRRRVAGRPRRGARAATGERRQWPTLSSIFRTRPFRSSTSRSRTSTWWV